MTNQKGFSLLEILIAITLLSFIMLAVISVSENSIVTKERVTAEDKESLQIETAMSKLQFDFNHIYSPLFFDVKLMFDEEQEEINQLIQNRYQQNERYDAPDYNNRPIPRFSAPEKDTFEFFTLSNRRKYKDQKQSRFAWVRYSLETVKKFSDESEDTKALVRYFSADNPYANERIDANKLKPQILLEGVESLVFSFWDQKNLKWQDSLDIIENGENKIRGLKITIKWKDSQGFDKQTTRIYRSLFPDFTPEDPYQIIKKKLEEEENKKATSTGTGTTTKEDNE